MGNCAPANRAITTDYSRLLYHPLCCYVSAYMLFFSQNNNNNTKTLFLLCRGLICIEMVLVLLIG